MPKVMCCQCNTDFEVMKKFMIKLNEGQAVLAERLNQINNIVIQMPNMLAHKRPLFKDKYPCMPKAPPKPRLSKPLKTFPDEVIVSEKRTRKLPQRLAESVQGCDLDNIFVKDGIMTADNDNEMDIEKIDTEALTRSFTPPLPRHRGSGRQRNKCDICGKSFKLQGRLAHHR